MDLPVSPYRVERLGDRHDCASFISGNSEFDSYLQLQAGQDLKRKVAVPFLMLNRAGTVVGYHTLSAYAVRLAELPMQVSRKLPKYPLLPATLLRRLAIGREYRGQSLGQLLLIDALRRSWKNTAEVASIGVTVDAYDEKARQFYLHHEFLPLLDHPGRLFISMRTVEKIFERL